MKLIYSHRRPVRASILMMTLVMTGIIGFTLASYLSLVSAQNRSVVRSQTWNATIPLIEAGIEEALAHLNQNGVTNIFTEGWRNEYGYATRRRRLGVGRYTVAITPTTRPTIECAGFLPAPIMFADSGTSFFAQFGYNYYSGQKTYISRTVRVTSADGALFAKGMVAKGSINMNGNNVASDSFDSADPNFSTAGRYDRNKSKDNGDVATNSGDANVFDAGNANLKGKVGTGAGGNVVVGANGSVGSMAWVNAGNKGIQPGYFSDDMNMSFPDIEVPFSGGFSPTGGSVSETNISYGTSSITSQTLPSPLPSLITTNYGPFTSFTYPSPVPAGGVITNYVRVQSTDFPTNPVGAVVTNVLIVTTNVLPNPIPPTVTLIVTNTTTTTNTVLPTPVPSGTIITNAVASSVQYPFSPMPAEPPAPPPNWVPPSPGTYAGEITNRYVSSGPQSDRGWYHDYAAIDSYVYSSKTYSITYGESYTFTNRTYTYNVPAFYTYSIVTSTNVTITTETYDYILDSRDYTMANLTGKVYVRGNARLHVTGSISFTGQGGITVGPNGSLKLYMSGASAKIAGNGIVNKSGSAANFMYYGLPTHTDLAIQGNGSFTGVIYAPYTAFKLGGGGNDTQDFIGASVTASVFMNGHFNFHYDEDLARTGPRSRYRIKTWNEVGKGETSILNNPDWIFMDDPTDTSGQTYNPDGTPMTPPHTY